MQRLSLAVTVALVAAFALPALAQGAVSNGKIAFVSNRSGNADIWIMDADGGNQTNLTSAPGTDSDPQWSPDGSKIAFSSDRIGNPQIYTMNSDGSGLHKLTSNFATRTEMEPTWSPDGQRIAFSSNGLFGNASGIGVYVANLDDSVERSLSIGFGSQPDWAPDCRSLAFRRTVSGDSPRVGRISADRTSESSLTSGLGSQSSPDWSPAGTALLYTSDAAGAKGIWTSTSTGAGATQIVTDPATADFPAWAPDGTKIAFASTRDGNSEIYAADANGANPVRLTTDAGTDTQPSWQPVGGSLGACPGPMATLEATPKTVATGELVTVTGSAAGETAELQSVNWTGGQGVPHGDQLSFSKPGTYDISITAVDAFGRTATAAQTIVVTNRQPTASITAGTSKAFTGATLSFQASGSDPDGAVDHYDWDFDGDGRYDKTTNIPFSSSTYETAGHYTPTVRVVDDAGDGTVATTAVNIFAAPTLSLIGPEDGAVVDRPPTIGVRTDTDDQDYRGNISLAVPQPDWSDSDTANPVATLNIGAAMPGQTYSVDLTKAKRELLYGTYEWTGSDSAGTFVRRTFTYGPSLDVFTRERRGATALLALSISESDASLEVRRGGKVIARRAVKLSPSNDEPKIRIGGLEVNWRCSLAGPAQVIARAPNGARRSARFRFPSCVNRFEDLHQSQEERYSGQKFAMTIRDKWRQTTKYRVCMASPSGQSRCWSRHTTKGGRDSVTSPALTALGSYRFIWYIGTARVASHRLRVVRRPPPAHHGPTRPGRGPALTLAEANDEAAQQGIAMFGTAGERYRWDFQCALTSRTEAECDGQYRSLVEFNAPLCTFTVYVSKTRSGRVEGGAERTGCGV